MNLEEHRSGTADWFEPPSQGPSDLGTQGLMYQDLALTSVLPLTIVALAGHVGRAWGGLCGSWLSPGIDSAVKQRG